MASILYKTFSSVKPRLSYSVHFVNYSLNNVNSSKNTFVFKSNLTSDEQEKILNLLNESNPDQLTRFSMSISRIENIEKWKIKNGPFKSLSEVLNVDGLGEKVLKKICENIISFNQSNNIKSDVATAPISNKILTNSKRLKHLVTPPLTANLINELESAVGIHLGPMGISWAKLSKDGNNLTMWDFVDFSQLPKKLMPTETFELALNVLNKIPKGDVYVLEANQTTLGPQGQTQPSLVPTYTQHLELTSMLIALLNTSETHNSLLYSQQKLQSNQNQDLQQSQKKSVAAIKNKVFHLRSKLPARLFRTLVGTERVAAITAIKELVGESNQSQAEKQFDSEFSLPCTPILVGAQLRSSFFAQTSCNKELLGQALMLVIGFMDLCVYKNPTSLTALVSQRKHKDAK